MIELSQTAARLGLAWTEGDPISLAFAVAGVDWSGPYTAQIRTGIGDLMGTLTVTATFATDTSFTLTMSAANSALIPAGSYVWDLQATGGVTRLSGVVRVAPQVTQ